MSTSTPSSTSRLPLLWTSIEPGHAEVRLMVAAGLHGTTLKARLPCEPAHPRAVMLLLEALAQWYGMPLHAVIDADGLGVLQHPERWALWMGDPPQPHVHVEWVAVPFERTRDRFLGSMGDFESSRRLLSFASTGRR